MTSSLYLPDLTMRLCRSCWCGNVEFEWHGEPFSAKHCHCRDCQRLHGAPFQHAALYPKTAVRLKKNKNESLDFFSNHEKHSAHYVPCKVRGFLSSSFAVS